MSDPNEPLPQPLDSPMPADPARNDTPTEVVPKNNPLIVLQIATPATILLALVNIGVFVAMVAVAGGTTLMNPTVPTLLDWGANFGPLTAGGQPWRLFTAMFLHIGLVHIFFNMWALWNLGRTAEQFYGTSRFVAIYILTGLAGSCASLLHNPLVTSAGASGAIFGILGALFTFATLQKISGGDPRYHRIQMSVLRAIAINLVIGFSIPQIDNSAHIGGLIFGIVAGAVFAPIRIRGFNMAIAKRGAIGTILLVAVLLVGTGVARNRALADSRVKKYTGGKMYATYFQQIKESIEEQGKIHKEVRELLHTPPIPKDRAHDLAGRADQVLKNMQGVTPNPALARVHQILVTESVNLAAATHALENYADSPLPATAEKVNAELKKSTGVTKDFNAAIQVFGKEYGIDFKRGDQEAPEKSDDTDVP